MPKFMSYSKGLAIYRIFLANVKLMLRKITKSGDLLKARKPSEFNIDSVTFCDLKRWNRRRAINRRETSGSLLGESIVSHAPFQTRIEGHSVPYKPNTNPEENPCLAPSKGRYVSLASSYF